MTSDEVSPTSKATQAIIPGAAYLDPKWKQVFIGGVDGNLIDVDGDASDPSTIEKSRLILLYVPGDKVLVDKGWTADDRWADRVIVHRSANV